MTKENGSQVAVNFNDKQTSIFEKIISLCAWSSLAYSIKETLTSLLLCFIRSERIESESQEVRSDYAFHLEILHWLLDDLVDCEQISDPGEKQHFFYDQIIGISSVWNCSDTALEVKSTLSILSLEYIRGEEAERETQEDRETISFHLQIINSLLSDIYAMSILGEQIEAVQRKVDLTISEVQTQDCSCIECLKKEGIIESLEKDLASKEKRIEDLIIDGPSLNDCKTIDLNK